MKYYVEILEIHKVLVEVELSEEATRDQVIDEAAQKSITNIGLNNTKYSLTLDRNEWVVRTENGDFVY